MIRLQFTDIFGNGYCYIVDPKNVCLSSVGKKEPLSYYLKLLDRDDDSYLTLDKETFERLECQLLLNPHPNCGQ